MDLEFRHTGNYFCRWSFISLFSVSIIFHVGALSDVFYRYTVTTLFSSQEEF